MALSSLRRRRTCARRVVCIHGIQSHGGWYEHSCRRLAEAGYEVYFLDRRGSGLNERDRGDAPGFRRLIKDVVEFLEALTKESPSKIFIVGISWGGKTAVGVEKMRPGLVDGIALLCPGFYPRVSLSGREKAAVVWARLTRPRRLFPIPLSDPTLFTATEKWLTFLREDPLTLHQATARFLIASTAFDFYLRGIASHIKIPVLLMLAGRDRIIDNRPTRDLAARFAGVKAIVEYPEAHHTLEFEPDPERHIADLLEWLGRQADGRKSAITPKQRSRPPLRGWAAVAAAACAFFFALAAAYLTFLIVCMGTAAIGSWLEPREGYYTGGCGIPLAALAAVFVFCFVAWLFRRIGWGDRPNPRLWHGLPDHATGPDRRSPFCSVCQPCSV